MYYNIKIKSKDSQFCLESNDKTVTQREMDIYFAHIFNVSEEFKSKIKKVEITNTNLKSINDIENISIQNQKLQPQPQTIVIQNSQPIQQSIQQPIQQQASQPILQEKISLEPIIPTPQPTLQMEKEILELAQQMPSIEKIIEEMQMPTNSTPLQANNNQNIQIQDYKINPKEFELTPIDEDGSIETPLEIQDNTSSTSSFQFKDDVAITPIETQEIIPQPEPQIIPSNDGLVFENIQETNFNSTHGVSNVIFTFLSSNKTVAIFPILSFNTVA